MDDIRVGSVSSYDTYGERQSPGSGKRRKHDKGEVEAEAAPEDFFESSEPEQDGAAPVEDYFAPSESAQEP